MSRRLAVLASQAGTVLQATIDKGIPVAKMYADRFCDAYDMVAARARIPSTILLRPPKEYFDRVEYSVWLAETLVADRIEVVAMMGFLTKLSKEYFRIFPGITLGSHPSMLPKFKGMHAARGAFEAGVAYSGVTIFLATPELDCGPIQAQQCVPRYKDDTLDVFRERLKAAERKLYPSVLPTFL